MSELTQEEIDMVLSAARKAKAGEAKPVMFFGTATVVGIGTTEEKLHIVDFMPLQKYLESVMKASKDQFFGLVDKLYENPHGR